MRLRLRVRARLRLRVRVRLRVRLAAPYTERIDTVRIRRSNIRVRIRSVPGAGRVSHRT